MIVTIVIKIVMITIVAIVIKIVVLNVVLKWRNSKVLISHFCYES